jgi:hypothetical protein
LQSWLRRDGDAAAVDSFKDFVAAAAEQHFADGVAQLFGIVEVAVARFAENLRAIGIGDDAFEMQLAAAVIFANFGEGTDRDLAASAKSVEERALAGGGGAGGSVVQEFEVLARGCVA